MLGSMTSPASLEATMQKLAVRRTRLLRIFAAELEDFQDPFHRDKLEEHAITKGELMWLSCELAVLARAAADTMEEESKPAASNG